jgi:hypothetical protein
VARLDVEALVAWEAPLPDVRVLLSRLELDASGAGELEAHGDDERRREHPTTASRSMDEA